MYWDDHTKGITPNVLKGFTRKVYADNWLEEWSCYRYLHDVGKMDTLHINIGVGIVLCDSGYRVYWDYDITPIYRVGSQIHYE